MDMSQETLETGAGSSSTLARGMALADQPLQSLLNLKDEPVDEEEQALRAEMQARSWDFYARLRHTIV